MVDRNIIAIGGGGFGRSIVELKIEKYIFEQASMAKPNICFIPTATGDDQNYIENFCKIGKILNINNTLKKSNYRAKKIP